MGTSAADEGEGIFWEPARQEPANLCVQSVTASGLEASMTPYKIMYEVIGRQVFVILVVHTKRNFQSLLQERLLRA